MSKRSLLKSINLEGKWQSRVKVLHWNCWNAGLGSNFLYQIHPLGISLLILLPISLFLEFELDRHWNCRSVASEHVFLELGDECSVVFAIATCCFLEPLTGLDSGLSFEGAFLVDFHLPLVRVTQTGMRFRGVTTELNLPFEAWLAMLAFDHLFLLGREVIDFLFWFLEKAFANNFGHRLLGWIWYVLSDLFGTFHDQLFGAFRRIVDFGSHLRGQLWVV